MENSTGSIEITGKMRKTMAFRNYLTKFHEKKLTRDEGQRVSLYYEGKLPTQTRRLNLTVSNKIVD